ncbi:MAG: rhodanese-related sulfurtransferase [Candidatus Rhabdochlamydia sp.]
MKYCVLAYYNFTPLEDPAHDVVRHKKFFLTRDIRSRIYISHEGINGQMSASLQAAEEYMEWMRNDPRFKDTEFKIHSWHEHCFPRQTVKLKTQLVALDYPADLSQTGTHLSPEEWKNMLASKDEETILIDVRNQYEWDIGHFEGAELPQLNTFREFPDYVDALKETKDPKKTKVMMYCTGGIRCELYSALMKAKGFDEVYQLQGGIIKYGMEEGVDHWRGKLFVFDDRLSVPISENHPEEIISHCHTCHALSDMYFNCANMDCNNLFLACHSCAEKEKGCCSKTCTLAPRVRAFIPQERPKPFQRLAELSQEHSS